ncbi:MAG: gamma-glutamyl phosphate reductase [Pelagibacteraceae bacterium BACL5 MAG-120820-bin39]|uniref:glutamate-5-semialdehyde dehydrogenase n=1 Tax=Candidatus Pelagibacter sp. TaxID=2024849 RepID=UPI000715A71A|nr:MAG: gamma-glutamyl phosphate reductase [Pelagibacteraceae bacterium BACL5 MAG-120820-bin39]
MKNKLILVGKNARKAANIKISKKIKNKVLNDYCNLLLKNKKLIIKENLKDIKIATQKKIKENLINRLILNEKKILQIIKSLKQIIKLKDPTNEVLEKWKRPNGLTISKVTIPIGVIGVIYESRPNVTCDVAALCFKSGNPVILKGGSEALNSNKILSKFFRVALKKNGINENFIQLINSRKREVVDYLLTKMKNFIDVIIPRGGKSLVKKVQQYSNIPVISHLEGNCHTYVDKDADLNMAIKIVHNAKLRNTAICGATETILFHKKIINKFVNPVLKKLADNGCKIIADTVIKKRYKGLSIKATNKDWSKEYLSSVVSVKSVNNLEDAINHINTYGTMHTDSIITQNKNTADNFLKNVKSSIAMHNTSTQFADGGEFGFGGEVGISTNTLPPRGPVGLNQLVSYKYKVTSNGQIRD